MNYLDELGDVLQQAAERLMKDPGHFQQHFGRHILEDRKTVLMLALREPEPIETGSTS